ncbi:MAG: bifunctional hydroxymethylpyrimidine kinase/phosphomethylpyrimidine kinase [Desulfobacteraceae bacterium]|nr:bifunctional hydroxymethylpyrimidine kinase/phosphomethylpyrimidine kinase [Desulfobacteraceae bacterium]MBC2757186.1 bifunctional hydroxymethylpyrimidine kinase/phosphomethylpyrimidine kinase [Desulfobacteraceae bacterium]
MSTLKKPSNNFVPTVLTIAGSDPSGGAGIQADLKTFTAVGVYGASIITALTAQNTQTVTAAMSIPADFVKQQLDAVLSDIRVDIIKLGMLPNADICETIAPYLKDYPVVCDPVIISTSGCSLIDDPAVAALTAHIIPRSTYITPNYDELKILYGKEIKNIKSAGLDLLKRFDKLAGIVLKGGHIDTDSQTVTDILLLKDGSSIRETVENNPRYHTKNTHGTGCTFASAFAAFLARKLPPPAAFSKAVAFTSHLIDISKDTSIGKGNGPLLHHQNDVSC